MKIILHLYDFFKKNSMKTRLPYVVILCCITFFTANSQNLLNTSSWTVGTGSVSGFSQNGTTSENSREYGIGPEGASVLLWKATPDASSNADGGWNSSYSNIDHTKTYRLVVWLKKTNSNDGSSYFGCQEWQSSSDMSLQNYTILKLNGDIRQNPYFWAGDLPQLNKWYMLVGYVHGSNYNSGLNYGGIYDPLTGNKVVNITDYKFSSSTTKLRHRTYLFYDTNTSDSQYFYAPRMELVDGNEPSIQELLGLNKSNDPSNMLDYSKWAVGTGSTSGFTRNGAENENVRELGKNHVGEEVVLWKAVPGSASDADGGWSTGWINASDDVSYRFSVWIKKTNSNYGSTYLGFYANNEGSLKLDGTYNKNPYFWSGDLPKLNRWYLIVGYVHKSSHTGTTNTGGIYDGTTGEKIRTITDYKLKNTVTALRHRSYLYYDTNILDRQYFYAPRIDRITGNEPTIEDLLRINNESKLIVSYDVAGNQTQTFYCGDPSYCSPPAAKKVKEEDETPSSIIVSNDDEKEEKEDVEKEKEVFNNDVHIYPNPTSDYTILNLSDDLLNNLHSIKLYNSNSVLLKNIKVTSNSIQLDMSTMAVGMYFVHIHLNKGKSITKKIVKK